MLTISALRSPYLTGERERQSKPSSINKQSHGLWPSSSHHKRRVMPSTRDILLISIILLIQCISPSAMPWRRHFSPPPSLVSRASSSNRCDAKSLAWINRRSKTPENDNKDNGDSGDSGFNIQDLFSSQIAKVRHPPFSSATRTLFLVGRNLPGACMSLYTGNR